MSGQTKWTNANAMLSPDMGLLEGSMETIVQWEVKLPYKYFLFKTTFRHCIA